MLAGERYIWTLEPSIRSLLKGSLRSENPYPLDLEWHLVGDHTVECDFDWKSVVTNAFNETCSKTKQAFAEDGSRKEWSSPTITFSIFGEETTTPEEFEGKEFKRYPLLLKVSNKDST
jgi:hypothetical protein